MTLSRPYGASGRVQMTLSRPYGASARVQMTLSRRCSTLNLYIMINE